MPKPSDAQLNLLLGVDKGMRLYWTSIPNGAAWFETSNRIVGASRATVRAAHKAGWISPRQVRSAFRMGLTPSGRAALKEADDDA